MFGSLFGSVFGLPLHPLVVHAVVIFVVASAAGVIALAVRPRWRHRFGGLLVLVSLASLASTWLAVESGNVLTTVPGLGSTEHARGGTLLLVMVVPLVLLTCLMYLLDRHWMVEVNKHGDLYRLSHARQPVFLTAVCVLTVLAALVVIVQTGLVGHTGAEATWGDVSAPLSTDQLN
jgi:predicted membrane protein DUF2231